MTEQEAYGVYYTFTKCNYYLQGAKVTVCNDHKPLARFLNGKNTHNKVNRWGKELVTYIITFKYISGINNEFSSVFLVLKIFNILSNTLLAEKGISPGGI